MKLFNRRKTVTSEPKAGGAWHLPLRSLWQNKVQALCIVIFIVSAGCFLIGRISELKDQKALQEQQAALHEQMQTALETEEVDGTEKADETGRVDETGEVLTEGAMESTEETDFVEEIVPTMMPESEALYMQNEDCIGWLKIEDTVIDYPVMQYAEDESFYLSYDFYKNENKNGCLVLDNDSHAGVGTKEQEYVNGSKPSTNLIIHGHTMKSGQMFGGLKKYQNEEYGRSHNKIYFDSLYEKREYELIAAFYSKVYYQSEDVFKYYNFFQADTQEEFDDWYNNIKELSLYDTGVTAELGDEFITLSCCAYHVEDGRFVVVGKRVD